MEVLNKRSRVLLLVTVCAGIFSIFSTASAGTIRKPPTNLGLTAYWPMNENAGTIVGDASGNRRDLKFNSAVPPTWTNGKRGKALNFGGNQVSLFRKDATTLPAMSTLISTATGTISVWVRPAASGDVPEGGLGSAPPIINDQFGYMGITQADYGADQLWAHNNDGVEDAVGITYTPGEWVHITWMHASSTLYVYKNGELWDSTPSGNTQNLTFGVQVGRSVSSTFFNGGIDEMRTYNRALTDSEIMRLYQTGAAQIGYSNLSPGTLSSGLVGHWTFDGKDITSAGIVDRGSGQNFGLSSSGLSTTTAPGKLGQAFRVGGETDNSVIITDPANGSLDMGTSDFSVSFWAKFNAVPVSSYLVNKGLAVPGFLIYTNASGKLRTYIYDGTTVASSAAGDARIFGTDEWYHVTVTFDRDGNMTRYVNAVQTGSATDISTAQGSISGGADFEIGSVGGGASKPDALMDDVRIYNRVLTASEITQLYRMGETKVAKTATPSGSLTTGLVAHYTFDGKDMYSNVADVSGNGYNGMLSGQAATTTVIGKIGQALNFDGTNDYVDLGDRSVFEPSASASFSTAFWYKGLKGSAENFISHSPSVATNYWFIDNDSAQFCGGSGCGAARTNSYTLPSDNDWHHLAVVFDRSTNPDSLNVYLDGVSTGTQSGTLNGQSTVWGTNTRIGGLYWAGGGYRQGAMDDVRFYNRALSASEAKQLYLLGK